MLFSLADETDFEVLVKSQCEADGFSPQRALVFHCLCSLISFAFSEAAPAQLFLSADLCPAEPFASVILLLLQSCHWVYFFKYILSLMSLTVCVTYRFSEDQYLCTQPTEPGLPLTWRASFMPVGGLLGPLRGTTLVASPPGFCKSLGAQMLCCISRHLYSSSQMYFCVFQIEMCLWCLSLFFQTPVVPTLRVPALLVSLPPAHPPRAPELLLTSSAFTAGLFPPSSSCSMLHNQHTSYGFRGEGTEEGA